MSYTNKIVPPTKPFLQPTKLQNPLFTHRSNQILIIVFAKQHVFSGVNDGWGKIVFRALGNAATLACVLVRGAMGWPRQGWRRPLEAPASRRGGVGAAARPMTRRAAAAPRRQPPASHPPAVRRSVPTLLLLGWVAVLPGVFSHVRRKYLREILGIA